MSHRLTVELNIKPGTAADFEAVMGVAVARVKAEDAGCEMYDLFKHVGSDTRYALIESWASKEDLDAHGKSPAMGEMAKIGPYLAGPPVMHRYQG